MTLEEYADKQAGRERDAACSALYRILVQCEGPMVFTCDIKQLIAESLRSAYAGEEKE
jgi:hypothetical protein